MYYFETLKEKIMTQSQTLIISFKRVASILPLRKLTETWKIVGGKITFQIKETGQCPRILQAATWTNRRGNGSSYLGTSTHEPESWLEASHEVAGAAVTNSLFFQYEQRNIHLFLWRWSLSQYPLAKEM